MLKRRILAGPAEGSRKLIFIFQRGGNDGVNTVIPRGDPQYSQANRPTLFIDDADALDLGNGFAQLHPALQPMMEIFNSTALNGVAGPGNLAVIHRVGYAGQSQSHFDSQQYWENGVPGNPTLDEGMLYRQIEKTMDPATNHVAGISISGSQMVALKGALPLPTISSVDSFSFSGSASKIQKFLGTLPTAPVGPDGKGLLGAYGGPRDLPGRPYRDLVYGTGLVLADSMQIVQDAVSQGAYTPSNGAVYPDDSLGQKLRQVAMLLKRTPVRILGANVGGWDTHTNQGGAQGYHARILGSLAQGFQALYRDLQDQWQDIVVVTMTEFGRTSKENGSRGTDHAYACVVFAAGGGVKGGVYNCDASTWAAGDLFSQSSRYVKRRTDYRAVFGEIFLQHFGDDMATLNQVIPGYSQAAAAQPQDFAPLGFL
jgi:uncharacterized protein (DUF1501 family)